MIMKKLLAIFLLSGISASALASITPEERIKTLVTPNPADPKKDLSIPTYLTKDEKFVPTYEAYIARLFGELDVDLECLENGKARYSLRTWIDEEIAGWNREATDFGNSESMQQAASRNVLRLEGIKKLMPAKGIRKAKTKKSKKGPKTQTAQSTDSGSFLNSLKKHWKAISMITGGVVILGAAAFFGWRYHNNSKKAPAKTK